MLVKLAWRNIWRNKRRAILTMSAVFFAVFFSVYMFSFSKGLYDGMVQNTLRTQTGHIQIHAKGFWDDKNIDNFMTMDSELIAKIEQLPEIDNLSPRVETFAMASIGIHSKGVAVMGVSPEKEKGKSKLHERVIDGRYLTETDDGILIGEGLAKFFNAQVGDTIALISLGYHGANAAALFPVRGVFSTPVEDMSNNLTYISVQKAQDFIDMPDGYSGILISLKNQDKLEQTLASCKTVVSAEDADRYEVLSWHYTMAEMLQTVASDQAMRKFLMFILYMIVGFGILGTVIMMTNERKREFSMMISLGLSRGKLIRIVEMEIIFLSLMGALVCLAVAIPGILAINAGGGLTFPGEMGEMFAQIGAERSTKLYANPMLFVNQTIVVLVMAFISIIYPVRKIKKLKVTENIRN